MNQIKRIKSLRLVDMTSPAWIGHIPFAYHLVSIIKPSLVIELGSFRGNSLNAFCQSVADNAIDTKVVGIDAWEGDLHMGSFPEEYYQELQAFINTHYASFASLQKSYFDDAVGSFDDGSIDLLHIDGLHTYEAVKHDFETWLPKLSNKAVVLFHDTTVIQKDFGVIQFWSEISKNYPSFNFNFSHGLGVLAVGGGVSSNVLQFIDDANSQPSATNNLFYGLAQDTLPEAAFDYVKALRKKEEFPSELNITPMLIDAIRDGALEIEGEDINKAFLLMELALKLRPNGPIIKKKYFEYIDRLKSE